MAINRQQTQSVNIPGIGEIEIKIPEPHTSTRTNTRNDEWDFLCPDWQPGDSCRGYYPRPEWWTYFGSDWHFLMIAGYINIEGQPTQDYPCAAPQYWADLDGFHLFISDLPYLEFSNSCSANCNYYCMDNGFGNVGNYISDYTSPSFIPDSDEGFCNCYCTSTPYDCVINQNSEEEGSHYPNKAHTGPHVATDRADAIGIFYTHPPSEAWPEGRRVLFGWNYVGGINGGDSEPNLSYPEQVISGVIIMTQLWASETAGGMFSEPTSHYPPDGTQLTIDNTEIIYYRATTNTFHAMSDESLQNILTINPYAPDTTWDGVLQNNMINFIADAGIGNFQYEYDEYGNQVMITDYGNMYQLNFGPPISNAIPLPPQETITDCRTDEDCRDGFICHAGKCVRPNVVPISRTTPGRQQSNRGGNIRGGQGIPGCTNPNALNFNPLATGCPPENPACCIFEEPLSWDCEEYGECYGPVQSSQQSFIFVCANRNDCIAGCVDGPNDDFSNYCDQIGPEQGGFGYVWYNEPCCSNDSYPINAEYWDVNNDMNFPTLESEYYENITWEPHDSLFFMNCGNDGTECISNDPEWLFGSEANSRMYSHLYIPPEGYQHTQSLFAGGNSTDGGGNSYIEGAGFIFPLMMYESIMGFYDNYPSPGDRIDMMIYKRSRGLLYRTDNFDGNSGNLIFPKVLADDNNWGNEWLYWPDEFRVPFLNSVGNFTKVFPTGGVQIVGCTDPEAYNYNSQAQIQEQGQCNYDFPKEGCTDSMCENFEQDANFPCMVYDFDTGGYISNACCENCFGGEPTPDYSDMPVGGCMNHNAYNYNPNATYDNGTCNYDPVSYISCETDEYCQTELSPTHRCVQSHGQGRVCLNFAGDVSGDGVVNYTDLCMMASHILQTPIQHELCSGLVGAGGVNPSTVFTDPISPDMFQFGDLDEDGIISISDFIAVTTLFVYQTFNTYSDFNQALDEIETMFGLSDYVLGNQSQSRPRPIRSVNQDRIISSDRTRTTPSKQQSQRQSVNIPDVGEIEPAQQMIYDYFKQQNLLDNQPYTFMMENGQVNEIPITDMDGAPDLTGEPCIFQPFGWPEDGTLPATRYYVHNFNSTQTTDDEFNIIDPDPSDPVSENIPECWPLISNPSDCYAGVSMTWYCLPSSPEYQLLDCEDYEFSYMTGYGCSINDIPCIAAQADACESQRGCTWTAPYFCQHIGQYGSPTTNINCVGTCCPVEGEWDANCDGIDDATFEQTGECESLYQSSGMICPDGSRNTWGQCGPRSWSKLMGPDGGCGHSSYQNNPRACDESQCGCKYCHTSDRCLTIEEHNATCEDDMCSGISVEIFGQEYDINTTTVLDLSNNQLTGEIPPEIGCLTNLTQLKVSFNNLSGPLPPEMQQLTNLISLELDHTYLSGEIPTWIGNLNLNRFNIYGSSFTGVIPEEICNWFVEPFDGDVSGSYFDYNDEWIVVGNVDVRNNFLSPFWPWCFTLDLVSGQMTGAAPPAMYLPQQNGDRNGEEITQTRQTTSTRNYVVNDNLTGQQNLKKKQILINKIKKQQKNN